MLSILVKDMLLPKSCYECPLNTGEYSPAEYEKRYCAITDRSMYLSDYKKRPSDCPLVELPEKHGRLINADFVIEKASHEAKAMDEPFKSNFDVLVEWIVDKTPTVIEAERSE